MNVPRDDLIRMHMPARPELRAEDDSIGVLAGHFAVFDHETVIDSWEGRFREKIAAGAFRKTIRENRDSIKVLYDHGFDGQIGNKVLAPIRTLEEDGIGVRYEAPLFDTSYNRDLLPGLRAGVYGASFRFRAVKDEWEDLDEDLPLRIIRELALYEFGPVTFPAYQAATAGVRSRSEFQIWQALGAEGYAAIRAAGTPPEGAAKVPAAEPVPHSTSRAALDQKARRLQAALRSLKETP